MGSQSALSSVLPDFLDDWLARNGSDMIAVRRHIHANPELSRQEFKTTQLVATRLTDVGLRPRLLPTKNGILCDIGAGSHTVALRADLDALPIQDVKDVPYRSTVPNVCHACGHDVHTTIVLAAGLALAELAKQGQLPGRVRLIFQPSEERMPSGAPDIIAANGLRDVNRIFGLHCAPQLACGIVAVRSGPLTAAADFVEVRLRGEGGHSARPHATADLVHAIGRIVTQSSAMLVRKMDRRFGASIVFGAVSAGQHPDAIPGEAVARGTVRVLNHEGWHQLRKVVPEMVHELVAGLGVEVDVLYVPGVPPVINDPFAAATVASAAAAALGGDEHIHEAEISMGGEDFAFYLEHVPGAMLRLGVAPPDLDRRYDIHQSVFDVDERAIGIGIRTMVHIALAAVSGAASAETDSRVDDS
jgi:amidohydrolase